MADVSNLNPPVQAKLFKIFSFETELETALVYDQPGSQVIEAYEQILEEEGFPYQLVSSRDLAKYSPSYLKRHYQALIVPEEVNRTFNPVLAGSIQKYVARGGKLFLGMDVWTVDEKGHWQTKEQILPKLAGISYNLADPEKEPDKEFFSQQGTFFVPPSSPLRSYFDPGIFSNDALQVYDCPVVTDTYLPMSNSQSAILAFTNKNGSVFQKEYLGGGMVLYVNSKPGRLKYQENIDFVLRSLLKYFLCEIVRLPRLLASPGGNAGLVLAIHICSGAYFKNLDYIINNKILASQLPFSFFITAGSDNNRPGDGGGVDVLKSGNRYIPLLSKLGSIGSHGGWLHNYWVYNYNNLTVEQKNKYIDLNYKVLENVTGQPVTTYAAPGGAHDTVLNNFLANLGTVAASVPIDYNAPPTHGWFDGKKENRFWLFGYTGTKYGTAFENMLANNRRPAEIEKNDMRELVDAVIKQRQIRLFYFHPVSIAEHPQMWKTIQEYISEKVQTGDLTVQTMQDYAAFLSRRQNCTFSFLSVKKGYVVRAQNPVSLKGMTFALPMKSNTYVKYAPGLETRVKDGWVYMTVLEDQQKMQFNVTFVNTI